MLRLDVITPPIADELCPCRGAAQGEGLGNAFLSNITAVDGIFHVLRTFEDPDITHVEDRVDPVEDMKIIHAELRAKDLERVGKLIDVRAPNP
jgi:obg-like ATPase 1